MKCLNDSSIDYEPFLLSGRCWKVRFVGESVDDCGGGYSDSIAEICDELQNTSEDLPILIQTPNCVEIEHDHSKVFVFAPFDDEAEYSAQIEKMFIFLGSLIGCALRQGSPLSLRVHDAMWKLIKGQSSKILGLPFLTPIFCFFTPFFCRKIVF